MSDRSAPDGPTRVAIAGRLLRPFLPLAAVAPILALTLTAGRPTDVLDSSPWCVVCGARGIADGLLNVALFAPLGWTLAANRRRPRRALVAGLLLSGAIEFAQFFLPNRFPTLGDVLYNGTGAWLGASLWSLGAGWLRPAASRPARRVAGWAALGLAGLLATPFLLKPAFPPGRYAAEWAPRREGFDVFDGRLLDARLDGRAILPGTLSPRGWIRRRLLDGAELRLRLTPGPPPKSLAPVFIAREGERLVVLLVGVDDRDLVVRYRTWSERLVLDRPDFRLPGARAAWPEGEPVDVAVTGPGGGVRAVVGQGAPVPLTVPSSRGWAFLLYGGTLDRRWGRLLDCLWMGLWAVPLGVWGIGRHVVAAAAAWIAALAIVPLASPTLSVGTWGIAGVAAGALAGLGVRGLVGLALGTSPSLAPRVTRGEIGPSSGP